MELGLWSRAAVPQLTDFAHTHMAYDANSSAATAGRGGISRVTNGLNEISPVVVAVGAATGNVDAAGAATALPRRQGHLARPQTPLACYLDQKVTFVLQEVLFSCLPAAPPRPTAGIAGMSPAQIDTF